MGFLVESIYQKDPLAFNREIHTIRNNFVKKRCWALDVIYLDRSQKKVMDSPIYAEFVSWSCVPTLEIMNIDRSDYRNMKGYIKVSIEGITVLLKGISKYRQGRHKFSIFCIEFSMHFQYFHCCCCCSATFSCLKLIN